MHILFAVFGRDIPLASSETTCIYIITTYLIKNVHSAQQVPFYCYTLKLLLLLLLSVYIVIHAGLIPPGLNAECSITYLIGKILIIRLCKILIIKKSFQIFCILITKASIFPVAECHSVDSVSCTWECNVPRALAGVRVLCCSAIYNQPLTEQ